MTPALLERPRSSEALTNTQWRTTASEQEAAQRFSSLDISTAARDVAVPFGPVSLVFSEPPPPWFGDLLAKISELGNLEENWDSYGARPIDPRCALATTRLLLSLLDSRTPKPCVVPTARGGIQLEWHRAGADLEVRIESPTRCEVYFEDHREGTEREMTLMGNLRPLARLLDRLGETN